VAAPPPPHHTARTATTPVSGRRPLFHHVAL
jgi:hypothetical protein